MTRGHSPVPVINGQWLTPTNLSMKLQIFFMVHKLWTIMTWKFWPFSRVNISVQIIFIIRTKNRENPQFSRHYESRIQYAAYCMHNFPLFRSSDSKYGPFWTWHALPSVFYQNFSSFRFFSDWFIYQNSKFFCLLFCFSARVGIMPLVSIWLFAKDSGRITSC